MYLKYEQGAQIRSHGRSNVTYPEVVERIENDDNVRGGSSSSDG